MMTNVTDSGRFSEGSRDGDMVKCVGCDSKRLDVARSQIDISMSLSISIIIISSRSSSCNSRSSVCIYIYICVCMYTYINV